MPTPAAYADGVKAAVEAANVQISAAVAKGDCAAFAALYSPDGQVMPADSDPIRGTEAIQKFCQGALDSGVAAIGLKTIEVFVMVQRPLRSANMRCATRQARC